MIDPKLIQLLDSPQPEQRKRAIAELAKTRDPAALSYLATVYRTDLDPEVRELARKAGVYINKHSGGVAEKPKNTSLYGTYDDDDDGEPYSSGSYYDDDDENTSSSYGASVAEVEVSELDRERAQGLVQQALDMHMRGKTQRAIKYLKQAFDKNPNLTRDGYTRGLITTITGYPPDIGVQRIMSGDTAKGARKGKGGNDEDPGAVDALIDFAIYFVLTAGVNGFLLAAGYLFLLEPILNAFANTPGVLPSDEALVLQQLMTEARAVGFIAIVTYTLTLAFWSTVGAVVYFFFINIVAQLFLGGDGSYPRLVRKMAVFYALSGPLFNVLSVAVIFVPLIDENATGIAFLVLGIASFGLLFWTSKLIGEAYRFSTSQGCLTLFITGIVVFVASCVISFAAQLFFLNQFAASGGF